MTNENKGLWLGLLGVVIFSASLPMTKLAVYAADPAGKKFYKIECSFIGPMNVFKNQHNWLTLIS